MLYDFQTKNRELSNLQFEINCICINQQKNLAKNHLLNKILTKTLQMYIYFIIYMTHKTQWGQIAMQIFYNINLVL